MVFAGVLLFIALLHMTGAVSADNVGSLVPFFCPFKFITGIPCPGCGITHAVLAIAKGDLHDALVYNPFSFFLMFMVVVSVIPRRYLDKLPSGSVRIMEVFLIVVLLSVIFFWVFFRLAPHFP